MKLRLSEDPKQWRKQTLLTALGLALLSSLMRWRDILSITEWLALSAALAGLAALAVLKPRCCRGYYRLSMRLGFAISQSVGRAALLVFFGLILTPLGWCLRLAGNDPLRLKRRANAATYWHDAKDCSPLDRLF